MSDAETTDTDWDAVSHVLSSKYRTMAVDALRKGPAQPTTIADESGVRITHISRALSETRERGVVQALVDDATKKGRLYDLTDKGERVAEAVSDVTDR